MPETQEQTAAVPPLDSPTVDWLYELANANFKSQSDLDESVWRSMSFVVALFALSVAVLRDVDPHFAIGHAWSDNGADWLAGAAYLFGLLSFCAAFGLVVWIVWAREFLYPAKDSDVKRYATELTKWHRARRRGSASVGKKVVDELQLFMVDLLIEASERNLAIIRRRLFARSLAIIFILAGFAFICLSEATIYLFRP